MENKNTLNAKKIEFISIQNINQGTKTKDSNSNSNSNKKENQNHLSLSISDQLKEMKKELTKDNKGKAIDNSDFLKRIEKITNSNIKPSSNCRYSSELSGLNKNINEKGKINSFQSRLKKYENEREIGKNKRQDAFDELNIMLNSFHKAKK